MPAESNADDAALFAYSSARTRSIARRMPGSSDLSTSPTLFDSLMPLRSNGMWLPVTITAARRVRMPWRISAGVGILPAFSTVQPASAIACAHARTMRSVLGRRSPATSTLAPAAMSPISIK